MEQLKVESRILHPEVQAISREQIDTKTRITLPYYTKYEQTALLGIRKQQLADGSLPLVDIKEFIPSNPLFLDQVATKEIYQRKLPFIIHRRFPSGVSEYWSASELSVMWEFV
jgi:DNA-directed RNA polymerase I, II, and III subunit RPABC2